MLNCNDKNILSFYIGDGVARSNFFINLKATIIVMTMPDLETFHIKRSKVYPVHYVYIFHSLNNFSAPFGTFFVLGSNLIPLPAAKIIAFILRYKRFF